MSGIGPKVGLQIKNTGSDRYPQYEVRLVFQEMDHDYRIEEIKLGTRSSYPLALQLAAAFHAVGMENIGHHLGHAVHGLPADYTQASFGHIDLRQSMSPGSHEYAGRVLGKVTQEVDRLVQRSENLPKRPGCSHCGGPGCARCQPDIYMPVMRTCPHGLPLVVRCKDCSQENE